MKVMFYCQHVLGVGHFFRSMEIAGAFRDHQVVFLEGGEPLKDFEAPPHVKRIFLPAIMMDSEFSRVETRGGNIEEIRTQRKDLLLQTFRDFTPDVLIIELFPFGRKYFQFELIPLLKLISYEKMTVKVICSLRDILVEKKEQANYEKRVIDTLNSYFDLLLIHSDPQVVSLDETFSRIHDIAVPIEYTGFVTRKAPPKGRNDKTRLIVASEGGSNVGTDLLAAAIRSFRLLPFKDLKLRVFMSPFAGPEARRQLTELAVDDGRVELLPFSSDFLAELARADLSISMAGYNTCMDILSSGIRALVYPFPQNREQSTRARKLQSLCALRVLESLDSKYLAAMISEQLESRSWTDASASINKEGAPDTVHIVEKYFG